MKFISPTQKSSDSANILLLYSKKLLIISLLFLSSCHSYKTIDSSIPDIAINKKYRITTNEGDKKIMKVLNVSDSLLIGTVKTIETQIPTASIETIQKREFSPIKTFVLFPISYAAAGVGLFFLGLSLR